MCKNSHVRDSIVTLSVSASLSALHSTVKTVSNKKKICINIQPKRILLSLFQGTILVETREKISQVIATVPHYTGNEGLCMTEQGKVLMLGMPNNTTDSDSTADMRYQKKPKIHPKIFLHFFLRY